jgi:hypothetical protein
MKQAAGRYVVSFQPERFYQQTRYHWMICRAHKPDELVSWGYARTREQAETAAQDEVNNLSSGLTQGGRVPCESETLTRRLTLPRRFRRA